MCMYIYVLYYKYWHNSFLVKGLLAVKCQVGARTLRTTRCLLRTLCLCSHLKVSTTHVHPVSVRADFSSSYWWKDTTSSVVTNYNKTGTRQRDTCALHGKCGQESKLLLDNA